MKPEFHLSRRFFLEMLALAAGGAVAGTAFAYEENSPAAVNVDKSGVGLRGHDPVSYFTGAAPRKGKPGITAKHDGVVYRFASTANRDKFAADPARYAPQFGGFCAMGAALGKKLDVDPSAWRVVNDKLYLNVNKDAQKRWLDDVPGNIATAEKNWPTLKDKVPKGL